MKNKYISAGLILAAGTLSSIHAQADDGIYFAAGLGAINSDVAGYDSFDTQNVFFKVGKEISQNFSLEALLGIGLASDKWTSANGCDSQEVSTDRFIGVQAVGSVDLSPNASFHGTIGMLQTSATLKDSGAASCYGVAWSGEYSDSEVDMTYGVGIDYHINPKAAITADYQIFYDDNYSGVDLLISGVVLGYKQYF